LAVAVGNGLARFSYALLLPAMREDLAWTYAQAGWLNTANALGYIAGAVTGYLLLRRLSPARLFSLGLVLTCLSLPATGWSAQMAWLTGARLLSGIGAAWVFACGSALVAARYQNDVRRRGTATGLFFAGAGLGIALSSVAVNPLLAHLGAAGWPEAWLLLGTLALLLSIWPWLEARHAGGAANTASSQPLPLQGLWAPLLGYFLFAAGYIVYMTFILAWMQGQGWSWRLGLLVWLTLGIGVMLSPFVWRRALDRWSPLLVLSASCTATLVGTAIPLIDASAVGLVASAAVFGLGVFIAPSSVAVLVRQRMPAPLWAKGMTLFTVVFAIGQAIGPVAAGWIADATSLNHSLLLGLALLLAGALSPLIKPTPRRQLKRKPTTDPSGSKEGT
jgi:predicted MFS family arabinose efflux permease